MIKYLRIEIKQGERSMEFEAEGELTKEERMDLMMQAITGQRISGSDITDEDMAWAEDIIERNKEK